jgi:hypothetical protein
MSSPFGKGTSEQVFNCFGGFADLDPVFDIAARN